MKVTSVLAVAAVAIASVHATGPSGSTCQYGTPAPPATTASPGPTTTSPVPTTTSPVPTTTSPVPTTTSPDSTTTSPVPTTTSPLPTTTSPVPTTTSPEPTTTSPVPTTTSPVPTTTSPVPTTTSPEPTTTSPVPTTTSPVPTTTSPEPTTTSPEPTTTSPVPTTTSPVPTTTSPNPTTATPNPTTTAPPPAPVNCKLYTAANDPEPWADCANDGTGKWYKTKVLGVEVFPANGGEACPEEADVKRQAKEPCPAENCKPLTPEADQGQYSACSLVDGKYVKSKVLGVAEDAKFGGTCDPKDRTYTQPCEAIDCVAFTKDEDTGALGDCKDDGTGKWFKSKVLGIKTPAQFGGTECESDDKRTISEPCEPVDCVAVDEKDDTGAFGDCEKDTTTGIYYKSKVLAVKTNAIYGGKCDPKDRTVKQECKAVNCEAYTKETDTGDFGECKELDNTNTFYKFKVLGIKTPAQYGGSECESDEKRTISELCPAVNCVAIPVGEDTGDYGECFDRGDGKFIKTKVLGIKEDANYGGSCDPKDRTVEAACDGVDCVPYTIETDPGQFGECFDFENSGKFKRSKVLGIKEKAKYGGLCSTDAERTVYEDCAAVNCVAVDPKDDAGLFGDCTKNETTGKWIKSKVLDVKTEAIYGGTCDPKDRTYSEPCEPIPCEAYTKEADPGQFGECKQLDNTNTFYKYKVLGIKTPAQYGGTECESEEKRTISELCQPVNCVAVDEKDDTGAFGDCEKDTTTGIYYKSKVLAVKTNAIYGGKCDPKDRTVKQECKAVNCEAYTKETDPGQFGECKQLDNTNTFYKYKVLGIKTPAQYGGIECESDAKRTISELCPAVNCVAVDAKDDTGAYGECKLDATSGKWIKSKVLGVKTPAKYGGTCLDKDRTVTAVCDPVPCVIYPAAEDPGQFGSCVKDNTNGLYYKTKTLGVKTAALYGGSCPSDTDPSRKYREQCPPVNCVVTDASTLQWSVCTVASDNNYYRTKTLSIITQPQYGGTACPTTLTLKEKCPQNGYCVPPESFYTTCVAQLAQCGAKTVDRVYDDNELVVIKGLQLSECCDKCATTAGCAAYSFTPSTTVANNQCSLKWATSSKTKVTGAVSSTPNTVKASKCSFHDGGYNWYPFSNLKEVATNSLIECCDACVNTKDCKTFNLKDGKCELKAYSSANGYITGSGWRAGMVI